MTAEEVIQALLNPEFVSILKNTVNEKFEIESQPLKRADLLKLKRALGQLNFALSAK